LRAAASRSLDCWARRQTGLIVAKRQSEKKERRLFIVQIPSRPAIRPANQSSNNFHLQFSRKFGRLSITFFRKKDEVFCRIIRYFMMDEKVDGRLAFQLTIITCIRDLFRPMTRLKVHSVMKMQLMAILGTLLFSIEFAPLLVNVSQASDSQEMVVIGRIMKTENTKADKGAVDDFKIKLKTEKGEEFLLEKDEAARLFFLDPAMIGQKARLRIQTRPGKPSVTTINVEIENEGRWRVPQYYCDVCTIAVRYPQICLCCQGPMEFRFKPER
jgi:hypothetical protein